MRMTHHNGRTRADGSASSAKHNDRNGFTADHINPDPEHENFYRTINAVAQKPQKLSEDGKPKKSFDEHERDCYAELFGESLAAQNGRYTKSGHTERCKTIDEYRRSARTCPEETIIQLGNRSGTVSPETVEQFLSLYLFHMRAEFGDKVRFLDVAIHNDKSVPHAHIRRVWCATGKDGLLEVSQAKALEQLGIERPDPTKKENRHNNRKQTFSQMERKIALECARQCGLEIEEIPAEPGKQTMALEQYVAKKEREALAAVHAEKEAVKEEVRKLTEAREEVRAEVETLTQEKTRLQRLVSRLSDSLGRLFGKLQSIAMGRGTVLDYVKPEAQAVVDDLNELDNEEYEL